MLAHVFCGFSRPDDFNFRITESESVIINQNVRLSRADMSIMIKCHNTLFALATTGQ